MVEKMLSTRQQQFGTAHSRHTCSLWPVSSIGWLAADKPICQFHVVKFNLNNGAKYVFNLALCTAMYRHSKSPCHKNREGPFAGSREISCLYVFCIYIHDPKLFFDSISMYIYDEIGIKWRNFCVSRDFVATRFNSTGQHTFVDRHSLNIWMQTIHYDLHRNMKAQSSSTVQAPLTSSAPAGAVLSDVRQQVVLACELPRAEVAREVLWGAVHSLDVAQEVLLARKLSDAEEAVKGARAGVLL